MHNHSDTSPCILLIEDRQDTIRIVEAIAKTLGYRSITAIHGEHALELVKNIDFNLIITDLDLPSLSGLELTRAIRDWEKRNHKKPTPIIGFIFEQENTKKNCLMSGMTHVLSKPVEESTINEIINQYIPTTFKKPPRKNQSLGLDLPNEEHQLFELQRFPLLDINNAIKKIGNEELVSELLQLMLDQALPDDTAAITQAYSANNWAQIEKLAHKIKGGAVYCGTIKLQYACQYLERYRKAGHSLSLEALYRQLMMVIEETRQQIRTWLMR